MRALIAMSGGVDSSVAALLTQQQGLTCVGGTMRLLATAPAREIEDARQVAAKLGMPHHVFDFTQVFNAQVITPFVQAYEAGLTPNPCLACNKYLKFGALYAQAQALGCDYLVTGHYARIVKENGRYYLKKAVDPTKDQSYVLYNLTEAQLAHTLFPLGDLTKTAVRALAAQHGFINAHKRESQDICFVPDGDYAQVIQAYTGQSYPAGNFVGPDGQVLGQHRGLINYTIGQRRGLGVAAGQPLYVCQICPHNNTVCLGPDAALWHREVTVRDVNWVNGRPAATVFTCRAKIRYRHQEQPATVHVTGPTTITLIFDAPQRAVTPGQAAVLYDGDTVLGGGIITGACQ